MSSEQQSPPDLTGAVVYVETSDRPVSGGGNRHVLPDDSVIYERPNGKYNSAIINAETLRTTPTTWRRL